MPQQRKVDTHGTAIGDVAAGEIVVTARRREESLQRVPASIIAFSQQQLKQQSISTAADLQSRVPGLTVAAGSGNTGEPQFAIRGKGLSYGAAAGSVETYFAEVPLSAPFQQPTLPAQFFDLQSFQVLKGPQGTLFGRSTTGGAVLVVPQAPKDEFGGYARIQAGNYGDFQFEGAINLPIVSDKVDLRVAGFEWTRDGYNRTYAGTPEIFTGRILPAQRFDNQNVQEVRATLLLRPTDGLINSTIFTYHQDRNASSPGAGLLLNALGEAVPAPGYKSHFSYSDMVIGGNPPNRDWAIINNTSYEIAEGLTIKNIFGYIHASGFVGEGANTDGTSLGTIDVFALPKSRPDKSRQLTDEVQLQGTSFGGRLTWTLGGLIDQTREPEGPNDTNIVILTTAQSATPGYSTEFASNDVDSRAIFGSATLKINDRLSLTAGYRHSWNKIQQVQATLASSAAAGPALSYPPGSELNLTTHQNGDAFNADLEYHPSTSTLAYVAYKRGYKQGGFNPSALNSALANFNPETVDDFSAGLKTGFRIGGVTGRFNIEGFYDLYHDRQTSYLSLVGVELTTATVNVPATTFRGFDADLAVDIAPWLTVTGGYSFLDAVNTRWKDKSCFVTVCRVLAPPFAIVPGVAKNLAINPVEFAPRNKLAFTVRFHTKLAEDHGDIAIAPTVTYQSKFYTSSLARTLPQAEALLFGGDFDTIAHGGEIVPANTLLDLRVEWNHLFGSKLSAAMNFTNLTNRVYKVGDSSTLNYGVEGDAYGPPRMVTGEISFDF